MNYGMNIKAKVKGLLGGVLLCGGVNLQADGLDRFLQQLQNEHPFFRAEALALEVQKKNRDAAQGEESWVVQSSPAYTYQEPVSSSAFNPEEITTVAVDLELQRPVWQTGGQLSFGALYDYTDQQTPVIAGPTGEPIQTGLPRFHQHGLFATYIQPLLKNRGGTLSRLEADQQQYQVELQALNTAENQEAFLQNQALAYLEWAFRLAQMDIVQQREALAIEQVERTREQFDANVVDEVDLLRAEDGLRLALQRTAEVRSLEQSSRARLAAECGCELPEQSHIDFFQTVSSPSARVLLENHRTIQALTIQQKLVEREAQGLESAADPELNLELSGGVRSGDSEYSGFSDLDQPEVRVGLMFRYPLGNASAQAEQARNHLRIEELEARRETALRSLSAQQRALTAQIKELVNILKLNREQIRSAEKRTFSEKALYEVGRSPLTFVIESRDNEAEAHNRLLENSFRYKSLQVELASLEDRLLSSKE